MHTRLLRAGLGLATLLLLLLPQATAQKSSGHINFQWGEEYELPKKHEDLGFVGNAKDGYLQIGHRDHESLTFQKFDTKLHFTGLQETDISDFPRDYNNEFFTQLGDKYYWFFSTYEKSEDKETLYAQEIDLKSGSVKGKAREILATSKLTGNLTRSGFMSFKLEDKWNFYFSFDQKHLLVQYTQKPEHRDDNETVGFHVFDQNLQKEWGREVLMPYSRKKMEKEDFQVDHDGNVYTLAKIYNEEGSDRHHPDYHFQLLKWTKEDQPVVKIPFRFTDKFVHGASLTEDPAGNLLVSGLYSNKRNSYSSDGVFLMKLDPSNNELSNIKRGTYEFPAKLMGQFESARTRRRLARRDKKDEAEDDNLVLRKVVVNSDGSIQVIGEEYYVQMITYSTGRSTHTEYVYHYDDILAMTINDDGSLRWATKIPKAQQTRSSGGLGRSSELGFKEYTYGKDTYFFFMDRESNMELDEEHAPDTYTGGRGLLVAVKVDDAGKMSKEEIYDSREEKVIISPADFDEVGSNELIVRGRARHRESQAAVITFQ